MPTSTDLKTETLTCLATPPGEGGVHVLLLDGPDARTLVEGHFQGRRSPGPDSRGWNRLALGHWIEDGELLDEVLLARFPGSRGEAYEINAHGGPIVASRILDSLIRSGARAVTWSDFTEAVSGGDSLTRAAMLALPKARSLRLVALLTAGLDGRLSDRLRAAADGARASLAKNDIQGVTVLAGEIDILLRCAAAARAVDTPPLVLITGPPNAGKSTLFNGLLESQRALVNPAAGTTRDAVRETALIDGLPVLLCDTAGLVEKTDDPLEAEGVRRARALMKEAALILHLAGPQQAVPDPDDGIVVRSQADLGAAPGPGLAVSARTGAGMDILRRSILQALDLTPALTAEALPYPPVFSEALARTAVVLRAGMEDRGKPLEMLSDLLSRALDDLSKWWRESS